MDVLDNRYRFRPARHRVAVVGGLLLRKIMNTLCSRRYAVPSLTLAGLLLLALAVYLSGCVAIPNYEAMGAAQIRASQEKDGMVTCSTLPTPWGPMRIVTVDVDKGVFTGRYKVSFNSDCSFTAEGEAARKVIGAP